MSTTASTSKQRIHTAQPRLAYIDNVRWLMIMLVVTLHSAVTYSAIGSWYYTEPRKLGDPTLFFFAWFQSHLQAFFMGLLFLIAGYFTPASYDRKGPRRFIAERAVRLGVPTLIYAMFIHPTIGYMRERVLGQSASASLWAYLSYLFSAEFASGTGPMWFALALLIFSIIYTLMRVSRGNIAKSGDAASSALPTHRGVVAVILLMAVGSFLVRIIQPIGTNILNLQLCFFTQYIVLFAMGCIARRRDWFNRIPLSFAARWLLAAIFVGTPIWFVTIVAVATSHRPELLRGGLHWQSAAYSIWESFFSVGVCLGMLTIFREWFNHQNRFARFMSDNAFAVYVFHAPILVALALWMRNWNALPVMKFVSLTTMGLPVSFLVAHFFIRNIPGLRRVMV